MSQEDQMVILPASVFNQVTDYLIRQPYADISGLIEALKENARAIQNTNAEAEEADDSNE